MNQRLKILRDLSLFRKIASAASVSMSLPLEAALGLQMSPDEMSIRIKLIFMDILKYTYEGNNHRRNEKAHPSTSIWSTIRWLLMVSR